METTYNFQTDNQEENFVAEIEFEFHEGEKGSAYDRYGDPGDPPSPDEYEILNYKVIEYLKYDINGNIIDDLNPIPESRQKELDDKFNNLVDWSEVEESCAEEYSNCRE